MMISAAPLAVVALLAATVAGCQPGTEKVHCPGANPGVVCFDNPTPVVPVPASTNDQHGQDRVPPPCSGGKPGVCPGAPAYPPPGGFEPF
jgi:hypothetical protein